MRNVRICIVLVDPFLQRVWRLSSELIFMHVYEHPQTYLDQNEGDQEYGVL